MSQPAFDPGSFKDPSGRVFEYEGEIYRLLDDVSCAEMERFMSSEAYAEVRQMLVPSEFVAAPPGCSMSTGRVLHHRRVREITYCYEWCAEAWRDAALHTLDLQARLLCHGYTLKDATPFNVQFENGAPIFIDLPSIVLHEEGAPWSAMQEFLENFLYPLMARAYLGIGLGAFTTGAMGKILLEEAGRLFSSFTFLKPGIWRYVRLPLHFRGVVERDKGLGNQERRLRLPREALLRNVEGMRAFISSLVLDRAKGSHWEAYEETRTYDEGDQRRKREFVASCFPAPQSWGRILDVGANKGEYLECLADVAQSVVAVEKDHGCVDAIYRHWRGRGKPVLPLVMDFSQPTPALGWRHRERRSFFERFKDGDGLLALAIIHHLRITANVPLDEIVSAFAALAKVAVVEWVPESDPMVQALCAGKGAHYSDYNQRAFEECVARHFRVIDKATLSQGRVLYHLAR